MTIFVCDIETIANDRAESFYKKFGKYDPPATHYGKKLTQEDKDNWVKQKMQDDIGKSALCWLTCQINCIGVVDYLTGSHEVFIGNDEHKLLSDFHKYLLGFPSIQLIGKSWDTFDRPVIIGRSIVNNTGLHPYFINRSISDIDRIFSYSSRSDQTASLEKYAFAIGVKGKLGTGDAVSMLNMIDLSSYCVQDCVIVREMLLRYWKEVTLDIADTQLDIPL